MMQSRKIDINDPSIDSNALIIVTPKKGTVLWVPDAEKELIVTKFPKLKLKNWKRGILPGGDPFNYVRIQHEQGLDIAKALARHGLRTMVQDMRTPGVVNYIPLDAILRECRLDRS
jgi:hypothetical protein